jgi:hypothetical protein
MSDEPEVTPKGRRLAMGGDWWEIRGDEATPIYYVDLLTEARSAGGTVCLGFATGVVDANNPPVMDMACRLRMSLVAAQVLHQMLGGIISDALKPADKTQAN